MTHLYEITNSYQSLMNEIMNQDEISSELIDSLNSIQSDFKEKAVNVAAFIKNLEVEADGIEKAIKTMNERHEKIIRKMESLKEYLKHNLESCDTKEIKSPFFDIKIKMNPPSVLIKDETNIPGHYWRAISTKRVDKALIAHDIKSNIYIPGVELVRQTRIDIR